MRRETTIHPAACRCRACQPPVSLHQAVPANPARVLLAMALFAAAFGTALTLFN